MNNNQFSQSGISHKELTAFLLKAKKDISSNDSSKTNNLKEEKEFIDLVKNWSETSQKILLIMNNKEHYFSENISPKSLMAFGAMGAHITMALQALKATGADQ